MSLKRILINLIVQTPVSGINACIRLVYYYMDYLIGYFIKIRRLSINSNFVIFDRYFYDFIIDPHRSRIDIDIDIRKFFWTITPKPDLIFILVADNNIIYSRKQELTLEEIKRQLKEYRLFSLNNGGVILDTSNNLDTIIHEALKEIIINNTLLISDLRWDIFIYMKSKNSAVYILNMNDLEGSLGFYKTITLSHKALKASV